MMTRQLAPLAQWHQSPRAACIALLLVHVVLSVLYSVTTPAWQSHDETGHYTYARYLAVNRRLPPPDTKLDRYDEMHQPPLYYVMVALAIAGIDLSDNIQPQTLPPGGPYYVELDARLESFPYQGTALAIHVGRLVSVVLSTLAVACTYLTARALLPRRADIALCATAIHAFWPLFLFLGGAITNDIAISLFGSLSLLAAARLLAQPWPQRRRAAYAALACCIAGGVMSKDSAISLLLFGVLVVVGVLIRDMRNRRPSTWRSVTYFVIPLIILLVASVFVSGGRTIRQFNTAAGYATVSIGALAPVTSTAGGPTGVAWLAQALQGYFIPFVFNYMFGGFGWGDIRMPTSWYAMAQAGALLAAVGLLIAIARGRARFQIIVLSLFFTCVALAPVARATLSGDPGLLFGRFFLPGLSALSVLLAIGIFSLPSVTRRVAAGFVVAGIALVGLMGPSLVIAQRFQRPLFVTSGDIDPPGIQTQTLVTYGDSIRLLGYSFPVQEASPSTGTLVVFYWRALKTMTRDYNIQIEMFGPDGRSFGSRVSQSPGNGSFPTTRWLPGDTYWELYYLPVWSHVDVPTLATFRPAWVDAQTGERMPAVCEGGMACDPKFGPLPVHLEPAALKTWAARPALYQIGTSIDLVDVAVPTTARAGEPITVSLVWRATANGLPPATIFVHLISTDGKPAAQVDQLPRKGQFPTNAWRAGDVIPDVYVIRPDVSLPAGAYHVLAGMYDSDTHGRMSVRDASGQILPDNVIKLATIQVER
jgi:hypothetical protein